MIVVNSNLIALTPQEKLRRVDVKMNLMRYSVFTIQDASPSFYTQAEMIKLRNRIVSKSVFGPR